MTDEQFIGLKSLIWKVFCFLLAAIAGLALYIHNGIVADIQENSFDLKELKGIVNSNGTSIAEVKGIAVSTDNYVSKIFEKSDSTNTQLVALAESSGRLDERMTDVDSLANSIERQEDELSALFARVTETVESLIDVEATLLNSCEEQAAIRAAPLAEQFPENTLRENLQRSALSKAQANLVFRARNDVGVAFVCGRLVLAFSEAKNEVDPELITALRFFSGQNPPTILYETQPSGIRIRRAFSN